MKKYLFPLAMFCITTSVHAQQDLFAITGKSSPQIIFNDFRSLDLNSGNSGEVFLNAEASIKVFSQNLNADFTESRNSLHNAQSSSMAALAFDASGNDLVYVPMFSSNIYVLDTKTKQMTLVENNVIKSTPCDITSHITRMTTGADGNIYGITNSGSQFIKISKKNGKYTVTDLGKITDTSANPEASLQVMKSGFGGDMIADANGDLYVFAASGNVFKISIKNLSSEFVGKISGLPETYSLNGAAVNSEGNVVVASAKGEGFFVVNIDDLQAKPLSNTPNLPIYDLASKYLAHDSKVSQNNIFAGIDVYPTRVDEDFINIKINDDKLKGALSVDLYDSAGTKVLTKSLMSKERNSIHKIDLNNLKSGLYIVNVLDESGKQILSKKIIIQ